MICKKEMCTGCFACYNICPRNAIVMKEDDVGAVYPHIDFEKCIKCELCKRCCPQTEENKEFYNPYDVFAMFSKDSKIRSESTSGGAATLLSRSIIKNGGVVYGASNLFNNNEFKFIRIDKIDELYKIQGSKYVHCYINDAFKNVKKDLNNGIRVLFVGTSCQIDGLKRYLGKNSIDNLYLVDIICHGVSTQKLLFDELISFSIIKNDVKKIIFREKNDYCLTVYDKFDKKILKKYSNQSFYLKNFLRGNTFRENCYQCIYAKKQRISDVSLGDFWGLSKSSQIYQMGVKNGVSAFIINTQKGKELFELIKDDVEYEKREYDELILNNNQLNSPVKKNQKQEIFKKEYVNIGYLNAMKKINNKYDNIKSSFLYSLYKIIKNLF